MPHELLTRLEASTPQFVDLRRDLHRHPELGLREHRTSEIIASRLRAWGYEVSTGLARTGVVGTLRRGHGKRALGLRADIDALPIHEMSGKPWASRHAGVMHACGHDGHTAMLLMAAHHLAMDASFSGTLHLIFQPAEEGPGGAKMMVDEGLFERFPCDAVYAMHNMPGMAQGRLVFREGAALASVDEVEITLRGPGGHGAYPQLTADPIVGAASIVMALQTIVSRNIDPLQTAIVSVGALHAGKASNVIPEQATMLLSVRSLDRDVRRQLEQRIIEVASMQARCHGLEIEIDYRHDYPVLVNSPEQTQLARRVGAALLGEQGIEHQAPPVTGSEDFAYMLERCPGCYLLIGNGTGAGGCMVHTPTFDFNDANLPIGAAFWVLLTETYLVG